MSPVSHVARELLSARFEILWQQLELLHRDRARSPRKVHLLRVATRRAAAALDLFEPLLDRRSERWFRQRLRRIRRSAGKARDLDVMAERLVGDGWSSQLQSDGRPNGPRATDERHDERPESQTDPPAPVRGNASRARLLEMLAQRRERWRRPLEELAAKLVSRDQWSQRGDVLISDEGVHDAEPFRSFASRRLKPVVKRFFRAADRRLRDADELHALRIRGKKLRYALELCRSAFADEDWRTCMEALENLQETLGGFTDHAAAAERFGRWARAEAGKGRRLMTRLSCDERHKASAAREAFVAWWKPSRRRRLYRQCERLFREASP